MELNILMMSIFSFLIFTLTIIHFFKKVRFERNFNLDLSVILIGLSYLVFSTLLFLWASKTFSFDETDFLKVYSLIVILQTILLVNILYLFNRNKKIFYSFVAFIACLPFLFFNLTYFHIVIPICLLVIFLSFLIFSENHGRATNFLIVYSFFSLIAYICMLFLNYNLINLFLLPVVLFGVFFYFFLEQARQSYGPFFSKRKISENKIVEFLKHFVFIIIITNFVFIGTIGLHEAGHVFMASTFESCVDSRIVYEVSGFPHTEVTCSDNSDKNIWILAGFFLPIILSILLILVGGVFIKEIALEIFGFNLAISYLDFKDLGLSISLSSFFVFSGVVLCALSIALLARSRAR